MKILVANLGSTSFKFRLFDMTNETELARGGVERIGTDKSRFTVEMSGRRLEDVEPVPDHAAAVRLCLGQLAASNGGPLSDASDVAAIGLKAVHGGRYSGVQRVTEDVLDAMEEMSQVAPAHNPPYLAAMRLLSERLPDVPLVAAFETAFHDTIPDRLRHYAVPLEWAEKHQVKRWGFHGASHRYIGTRIAELLAGQSPNRVGGSSEDPRDTLRVISCHLGGSSSLCAMRGGRSVATSMGMSPQTGLPHNNRAGDFDAFALPVLMKNTGKPLDVLLDDLAERSGLLGLSGESGDLRDLEQRAAAGDGRAQLAIDVFTTAIRHYLGAMLVELGGSDAIVFTGGIGQHSSTVRSAVCADLNQLGIVLDQHANKSAEDESPIHAESSRVQIWVVPTNEEIIVARQTKSLLENENA